MWFLPDANDAKHDAKDAKCCWSEVILVSKPSAFYLTFIMNFFKVTFLYATAFEVCVNQVCVNQFRFRSGRMKSFERCFQVFNRSFYILGYNGMTTLQC